MIKYTQRDSQWVQRYQRAEGAKTTSFGLRVGISEIVGDDQLVLFPPRPKLVPLVPSTRWYH